MSLPRFSVSRPVTTTMVMLIIVVLGVFSFQRLQIDLLPNVEMPTVTVRTNYEGASPEVMERLVTQIVEEIVATVPGVEEISSQSEEGRSQVRVTFVWGTDLDAAAADIRSALENELSELPDDVELPNLRKFDVNSFPVVVIGVSSDMDPVELTEFVEEEVRYRFGRIPGVAQVDLWGGFNREIRVEVDDERLKSLGIPLDTVLAALRDANLDLPAGKIEEGHYEVTLRAPAEFQDLDQIGATVIATREGAPVKLEQIARVVDTFEKRNRIERINDVRGIRVALRKQATANTVEVSHAVLAEIERMNDEFPQVKVVPVINQGNFIERSISNVAQSVLYGGTLAVVVLLLFLGSLRSTFVISVAIPISIMATLALLYFSGFTLNLMTLGGLALGVGMMVDNSIVVLENIYRRRQEEKDEKIDAAVKGTSEVAKAIIASTITTLVIFLPLVFVKGVSGILFQDLAVVVVFSLTCSLFVSLTLVPMLSSRLVAAPGESQRAPSVSALAGLIRAGERVVAGINATYRRVLLAALSWRKTTVVVSVAAFAASIGLVPLLGTEFMPPSDEGEVRVSGEMDVGTKIETTERQARRMEEIVYPAVSGEAVAFIMRAEEGGKMEIQVSLVPASARSRSNVEIAGDLRKQLAGNIPGTEVRVKAPQGQFLLDRVLGGSEGITVEIRGYEIDTLTAIADRVKKVIADVPGITDIDSSRDAGTPQESIAIDREKAADLGVSVRSIAEAIETAIAGTQAGHFRAEGKSHRILLQLQDPGQMTIDDVLDLTVTSASGEPIALRNVVYSESTRGPVVVDRKDQQRIVSVTANVAGRDLGSVAADVNERIEQIPRPRGYDVRVGGSYEEQQKAFHDLLVTLGFALLLVYMVLASQYESLVDPLIVMLSVPMAFTGVFITLFATGTTLNVQSYIGCIMLGGIVVNNAILLVDQAGQLRREGATTRDAAAEAGRRRLRPILMTTLTTILGLLPLAFGIGEGADAQAPLARAVIGGLSLSTLVTLVLVPAVYTLVHREAPPPPEQATAQSGGRKLHAAG